MNGIVSSFLVLGSSFSVMASESEKMERLPNIIFVLADDLGIGDLSCYGQKHYQTPHIDSIAQNGMRFTQFYSSFPVCAPARCSILTGKNAGHCGIRNNGEILPEGQTPMPSGDPTIAEMLKTRGYATACIGKWGLGSVGSIGDPNKRGFDFFYGLNCQRQAHFYYPKHVWRNNQKEFLKGNNPGSGGPFYLPDLLEKEAHAFIRSNRDKPFFLWYTSPLPHASLQVKDSELARFKGKFPEPKPYLYEGGYAPQSFPRAAAATMNVRLDDEVGRLQALLKELKLDDDTIFIFASDNGPSSEGGKDIAFFNSTGGDRKAKGSLFNGGVHVPFLISWPNHIKPGSVCEAPFAFYDLLPTFSEVAEVKSIPQNDGVSLVPTLSALPQKQKPHDTFYWEFGAYGGQVAVRLGDWRGVAENLSKGGPVVFQLFDLAVDPKENKDLSAEHPEIIDLMMESVRESRTPPVIDAFQIQQLEYLSDSSIKIQ